MVASSDILSLDFETGRNQQKGEGTMSEEITIETIPVENVVLMENIRRKVPKAGLKELASSIEQFGLRHPVTVSMIDGENKTDGEEKYLLREGYRRFKAVTSILGWEEIPATVIDWTNENDVILGQLVENLQREALEPFDEAVAIQRVIAATGQKAKEVAMLIGKSPSYVSDRLKILKLDKEAQEAIKAKDIPVTAARELAKLPKKEQAAAVKEVKARIKAEKQADSQEDKEPKQRVARGEAVKAAAAKRSGAKPGVPKKPVAERLAEQRSLDVAKFAETLEYNLTDDDKSLLEEFYMFLFDEKKLLLK